MCRQSIRTFLADAARELAARPSGAVWRRLAIACTAVWLVAVPALAGSGSHESTLVNVADTRGMPPGIGHWIADVYNQSLWLYGLAVVLVMAGMGLVLGLLTDRLVGMLGVHLGRITHWE